MSDTFIETNGLNQYYLQVQALTPSEHTPASPQATPAQSTSFFQMYLPIALLVGFVGISATVLFSKRVVNQGGVYRALGLAITAFAIVVGGLNIQKSIELESHASPDNTPINLAIGQVTSTSFEIAWETESPSNGFIQLYKMGQTNATSLTFMSEHRENTFHSVKVDSLLPASDYAIRVNSEGEWFDLEGKPLIVTTLP